GIALAPFTGGLSVAILGGAALGGGISLVSQGLTKGWSNIDWNELGKETAIGGISNALGFGALKYAKSAGTAIMASAKTLSATVMMSLKRHSPSSLHRWSLRSYSRRRGTRRWHQPRLPRTY
ncbi:hypothetical protein BUE67_14370, partial [Corynebacterium diphtheriae]